MPFSVPKINFQNLLKNTFPCLKWLPTYTLSMLIQDFLAGITVGMTEIPQGIGYAVLAGLPPEYGLYSGLLDGFIYAIFGGVKELNIGPSSLLSLMIATTVSKLGPQGAILATFLSGLLILIFGVARLGFASYFFSYPVIAGFLCGGCIFIASMQLVGILGISGDTSDFISTWTTICTRIDETRIADLILGIGSLIFLIIFKKMMIFGSLKTRKDWSRRKNLLGKIAAFLSLSSGAMILVIGTTISYIYRDLKLFKTTGVVTQDFPKFRLPVFNINYNGNEYSFFDFVSIFGISIMMLPLISILESLTVAKIFSRTQKLYPSQEMLALGLCNFVGSFIGSMPVTGSFTRTTINNISGVKTTLSGVFTSILLIIVILFLTSTFVYVPKATLAALLINAVSSLFDYKAPILFWKTKKLELIPFLVTVIGVFLFNMETGILMGAGVNLLFVLYASARPKISVLEQELDGENIFVVTPNDTLFFPAAEYLRDFVLELNAKHTSVIINGKNIRNVDATVAKILVCLVEEMKIRNSRLVLCNFKKSVERICRGVDESIKNHFCVGEE